MSLQVVLQVLHMYFIKKEKVKKYKSQLVHESDHDKNTNLAVNQLKSLNHLFDLFRALIGMSSIGIGMQKIAIHSQIIGLKAVLKISNIVSK